MEQLSADSFVENVDVSAIMEYRPYEACIAKLSQLEETMTPVGKLKVILSTAEKIETCISEFDRINSLPVK